jgi:hypothetical protein
MKYTQSHTGAGARNGAKYADRSGSFAIIADIALAYYLQIEFKW